MNKKDLNQGKNIESSSYRTVAFDFMHGPCETREGDKSVATVSLRFVRSEDDIIWIHGRPEVMKRMGLLTATFVE